MATTDAQEKSAMERMKEKVENYKKAVEVGKSRIEKEHKHRIMRYESFEKQFNPVPGAKEQPDEALKGKELVRDEAFQRFAEIERQGIVAKFKAKSTADFESLRILGEGAFGVVHLVRRKDTEEYYALKRLRKAGCKKKNHIEGAFAERDLLSEARSKWFVELHATFQDVDNVYMVMEFLQGGDLISYLMKKGRFTKEETRFYMAELLEALDTVHKCGFVHRDIKPDNMVLTNAGHLKLLDFGLCRQDEAYAEDATAIEAAEKMRPGLSETARRRQKLRSVVGTPQYMAPEVFRGASGIESDIWSAGVLTFECLVGHVPFHAGELDGMEAIRLIRDRVLRFSELVPLLLQKNKDKGYIGPPEVKFLEKVLCDRSIRLKANQCRRDPFFFGVDFSRLHEMEPPIKPKINHAGDASCFDDFESRPLPVATQSFQKDKKLDWAHYEFDKEAHEYQQPTINKDAVFDTKGKGGYSQQDLVSI